MSTPRQNPDVFVVKARTLLATLALGLMSILMLAPMAQAQTLTTLVNFNGTNGSQPAAGLIEGTDGNFYGTTTGYGTTTSFGSVFKMTPTGTLTTLINFNSSNGANPFGGLIRGTDGNFYGTTASGGTFGAGTIFRITPGGVLTTLVNFNGTNGSAPYASLIQGSDGSFYGTTTLGGTPGFGTVFKMTIGGTLTTLVNFNRTNGSTPYGGLVQGTDGNFYGTTYDGGSSTGAFPFACTSGCGTVFKMTGSGTLSTLYNFTFDNNTAKSITGSYPNAGLVQGSDGNFYGTTSAGGTLDVGTIFKITSSGTLTTMVNFNGTNGSTPQASLIQGSDGSFYGTTFYGSGGIPQCGIGCGTVFKMTLAGNLTTLFNFTYDTNTAKFPNGRNPQASLLQASNGNFYSTTLYGNTSACAPGCGTVFQLTSGLTTSLSSVSPGRGNFGATVILTGANLTGTTSVTFNGLAASFTVNSSTQITATVPPKATTGLIQVIAPAGIAISPSTFTVNPVAVRTLGWQQAGTGDFNSDGKPDLLWRNYTTGVNRVWFMNGISFLGQADFLSVTDTTWQLVGAADLTNDGKPDLVWRNFLTGQNSVWQMNGTSFIASFDIGSVADANWQLAGIGDLTNDTKPDLIWRNYSTGDVYVWQMSGYTFQQAFFIGNVADPYWQMTGVGDLTKDGQADLLWRYWGPGNGAGDVYLWRMNGYSYQQAFYIGPVTDFNYQLTSLGEFTGDGQPDLFWSNNLTGDNYVWQMNGYTYNAAFFIGPKPSP